MRIQHNIMAMNAYRNYTNNVSAMKSNLEKLSSGYKINRAGDDAAGLAISEKMRAQITGLQTAQKNAKDGISLVQTAEGALTEVHDMLNRMVELATQSANGTYDDDTDREQLQKELDQLLDEVNRIADSSNFNGIKLLNGDMDAGTNISSKAGEFSIGAGTAGLAEGVLPKVGTVNGTNTILHGAPSAAVDTTTFGIELHDTVYEGAAGDTITITIGTDTITADLATGTSKVTAADIAEALTGTSTKLTNLKVGTDTYNKDAVTIGGAKFKASLSDTGTGVTFTQDDTDTTELTDVDFAVDITSTQGTGGGTGTAPNLNGLTGAALKITAGTAAPAKPAVYTLDLSGLTAKAAGKLTFGIGTKTYDVTVNAGDTASMIAGNLKAEIDKDKPAADATAGAWTVAASGDTITFTGANNAAATTALTGNVTIKHSGDDAMDAVIENVAETTGTTADGTDSSAEATVTFDLSTLDLQTAGEAGQLTFTINGHDFDVAVAKNDDADAIITKLKAKIGTTEIGEDDAAGKFTLDTGASSGTELVFKSANQAAMNESTMFDDAAVTVAKSNTDGATGKSVAQTQAGNAGGTDTATFDLTGAGVDGDGGIEFTIGGNKYTVTGLDNTSTAASIATALVAKINENKPSDATTGEWTASLTTAGGTGITLTAEKAGTPDSGDLGGAFTAVAVAPQSQGGAAGLTGTWNVKTTDQQLKKEASAAQLATTHFTLTKDMASAGASVRIGETEYKFTDDAKATDDIYVGDLDLSKTADLEEAARRLTDKAVGNTTYTVGQENGVINVTENVGYTTGNQKYDLSTPEGIAASLGFTTSSISKGTGKALTLQIGDTADSYNQLKVNIRDMHAKSLGLEGLKINDQDSAAQAINKIKAAINTVSDVRGTLGATQNRLDHTINNLSVMTENIQDAESTIRDVDVAEEMMAYTKNNILIQSAQAMLAQANQVPQGVLQLLG